MIQLQSLPGQLLLWDWRSDVPLRPGGRVSIPSRATTPTTTLSLSLTEGTR